MKRIFLKTKAAFLLFVLAISQVSAVSASAIASQEKVDTGAAVCLAEASVTCDYSKTEGVKVSSRFYELLRPKENNKEEIMLCPSGEAFGILIKEDGVTVCSSSASGLRRRQNYKNKRKKLR